MTDLRLLPKPDGHDLRVKRATKAQDASQWLPEDALFEVSTLMGKRAPTGAFIAAWYEECDCGCGNIRLRVRQWHERHTDTIALATEVFRELTG